MDCQSESEDGFTQSSSNIHLDGLRLARVHGLPLLGFRLASPVRALVVLVQPTFSRGPFPPEEPIPSSVGL